MDYEEAQRRYKATCRQIELTKEYVKEIHTTEIMHHLKQGTRASIITFSDGLLTRLEQDKNECLRILRGKS